jgi:hypothetical protein
MHREPQVRVATLDEFIALETLLLEAALESTVAAARGWQRLLRSPPRRFARVLRETGAQCREPFSTRLAWLRRTRGQG